MSYREPFEVEGLPFCGREFRPQNFSRQATEVTFAIIETFSKIQGLGWRAKAYLRDDISRACEDYVLRITE